jgi:hypothetical protein
LLGRKGRLDPVSDPMLSEINRDASASASRQDRS